jgi:predicted nucleic acid-binding protein
MRRGESATSASDSPICVDASVLVKWLIEEADGDRALRLYADVSTSGSEFVAPPWFLAEASSAVYKRVQQERIRLEDALPLIDQLEDLKIRKLSPPGLARRAFEIAAQFELKWIYDAFYVALAEIVGCDLWTADEALHAAVSGAHANVRLLSEYPLTRPTA